ncbi:MAG TPA: hypothetical protein VIF57_06735 [Polyangia bacterium]
MLAAACGGSSGPPADAGADVPLDTGADGAPADAGVDTAPLACDPGAQNCPVDQKCDFRCDGNNAVVDCGSAADGGAVGSTCSTITMPCARGSGCVVMAGGGPMCRKYCTVDGDCATGERCHNDTVGVTCATTTNFLLHFCY